MDAGGEVRHIRPKDPLTFGVIEGNTIGHDVDPSGIDPTDTKRSVADTDAWITRCDYGWSLQK